MSNVARCAACAHHPHPGRACRVQRVTGPPSGGGSNVWADDPDTGKPVLVGYDHGGRTVTQCPCDTYVPYLNGADRGP